MNQDTEQYRDSISTVDKDGKRIWLYPKKPKGAWTNARTYVSWVLLVILFVLPFIKINGNPLIMVDILDRNFYLFGMHFAPQDFYLFGLSMLTMVVFIALFTVVFGRLFCGWVCPQTIFMEMVFRKIEYWIEGDAPAQKRLNKAPWTSEKIRKKVFKQTLFILVSVLIAHTFLSYIIGPDRVYEIMTSSPAKNMGGFLSMVVFTGAFYFVFASLREQVCTTICPYGRLQGVLTDNDTVLVTYDFVRGEPRGRMKKKRATKKENPLETVQALVTGTDVAVPSTNEAPLKVLGDCIDCNLCVHVCPTGIDIRNGTQLECVNCTVCIDACDEVMVKVGRDTGLIRYDSFNGVQNQERKFLTPRSISYSIVLVALIIINIFLFSGRSNLDVLILRTPGRLSIEVDETHLSNQYNYSLLNKTDEPYEIEWRFPDNPDVVMQFIGAAPEAAPNKMVKGSFFLILPKEKVTELKNTIKVEVWSNDELLSTSKTNFLGSFKQ